MAEPGCCCLLHRWNNVSTWWGCLEGFMFKCLWACTCLCFNGPRLQLMNILVTQRWQAIKSCTYCLGHPPYILSHPPFLYLRCGISLPCPSWPLCLDLPWCQEGVRGKLGGHRNTGSSAGNLRWWLWKLRRWMAVRPDCTVRLAVVWRFRLVAIEITPFSATMVTCLIPPHCI